MAKLYQGDNSGVSGMRLALGADAARPVDVTELEVTELELSELELAELEATERQSLEAPPLVTATLGEFSSRPNALPASVEPPPVSLIQRRRPPIRR
jgi:hypothetical protein